jgi:hypothetical protein
MILKAFQGKHLSDALAVFSPTGYAHGGPSILEGK